MTTKTARTASGSGHCRGGVETLAVALITSRCSSWTAFWLASSIGKFTSS
ncbi:MAG TPA: hypothetical protein VKR83_15935 [Ktedonobacteraceae bacterium]|nr:hypothetical protein [Ktedonobacteraceae bacterium]